MKHVEAVLLDLDDTLISSYGTGKTYFQEIARDAGLRIPPEEEIRSYWGRTVEGIAKGIWGDDYVRFMESYENRTERVIPFHDGVEDALRRMSYFLPLGIVTSRTKSDTCLAFEKINADPRTYFRWVFGCDEVDHHKPDPRVFDRILAEMEEVGIRRNGVIYSGDHIFDFFAARDAGLGFYGVTTGVYDRGSFLDSGLADERILDSISELPIMLGIDES